MLRKIADFPMPCRSSEHNPPNMIVLEPGTYEHTCPQCGHKTVFTVGGVFLQTQSTHTPSNVTVRDGVYFTGDCGWLP